MLKSDAAFAGLYKTADRSADLITQENFFYQKWNRRSRKPPNQQSIPNNICDFLSYSRKSIWPVDTPYITNIFLIEFHKTIWNTFTVYGLVARGTDRNGGGFLRWWSSYAPCKYSI